MRLLIESLNLAGYIAKCHEALRTGLRAMSDTRCFGRGYPRYWPFFRRYEQIVRHMFPEAAPDLLIAHSYFAQKPRVFTYDGLAELPIPKAFVFGDYWAASEARRDEFTDFVLRYRIDWILSCFPQPLNIWADTPIAARFIYQPPCFDPRLFNDWQREKRYDVGFLAAGTLSPNPFYPERHAIHQRLLARPEWKYLWARHPGWGWFSSRHPLVGRGFSQAINSCKLFITTGGKYRNAHAKYMEILASGACLLAETPVGAAQLGLIDGENYVAITLETVEDKIDYLLAHPDEAAAIAAAGHALAMRRHNCYARALEVIEILQERLRRPAALSLPAEPALRRAG